jgi:putative membrane protein
MMPIIATIVAALAALLHVYIFVMESIQWTQPKVWRRFGVADQSAADITRPMAYNQGFYNLFLAVVTVVGIVLTATGQTGAGAALVLAGTGSMVLAGAVLLLSSRDKARAALVQATPPLLAVVALVVGLLA